MLQLSSFAEVCYHRGAVDLVAGGQFLDSLAASIPSHELGYFA